MSPFERAFYGAARGLVRAMAAPYFRTEVVGSVPRDRHCILAAGGHRSFLDTPILAGYSRMPVRFMGAEGFFSNRILGRILYALGGFPVDRDNADRSAFDTAQNLLGSGQSLAIFPEGARFKGADLVDFKDGVAFLAARANVPVIPVGLGGLEKAMGVGGVVIWPKKVAVVFGEPMHPPVGGGRVKRSQISAFTQDIQRATQRLFDQAQEICS